MSISDWSSDVCSSDLKRVAIRRCDQAIGIHRPDQTPVDRRHPLLANVVAQPRLDFLVGARPEIERHELARALADSVGYIFAGDDQILARVIDAAQHDVGVRMGGEIGRAHVWTPVTTAHLACLLLLEKKNSIKKKTI